MISSYFSKGGGRDEEAPVQTRGEMKAHGAFRSPTQLAARLRPRSPLHGSQASVTSGGSRPNSPSRRSVRSEQNSHVFKEISGATSVVMPKRRAASPTPSIQNRQGSGQSDLDNAARNGGENARDGDIPGVQPAISAITGADSVDLLGDSIQSALRPNILSAADSALNAASEYIHKGVEQIDNAMGHVLPMPSGPMGAVSGSTLDDTAGGETTLYDANAGQRSKESFPRAPSRDTFNSSAVRSGTIRSSNDSITRSVYTASTAKSASVKSAMKNSVATGSRASVGSRGNLDFRHNDNSFFVITDLIVSRFKKEIMSNSPSMMLTDSDRAHLDRTVPIQARDKYVDAVRFRLDNARKEGGLTTALKHCRALGLHRDKDDDNILYARMNTLIAINQVDEDEVTNADTQLSGTVHEDNDTFNMVDRAPALLPEKPREKPPPKVPEVLNVASLEPPPRQPVKQEEPDPNSAEEIARQQLMEELRDASNLMAESVTPEAAKFWRKQVVELQARLRQMNGESTDADNAILRTCTSDSMSVMTNQSESVAQSSHATEEEEYVNLFAPRNKPKPQPLSPTPESEPKPAPFTEESPPAVESSPSTHTEEPEPEPKQTPPVPPPVSQSRSSESTSFIKSAPSRESLPPAPVDAPTTIQPNLSYASQSQNSMFRPRLQQDPLFKQDEPERLELKKQRLQQSASRDSSLEGLPIVDVVAPADLPGGYTFEAEIEGRRFLATVPFGGVREGETFCCFMRDLETVNPSTIPIGRWRDSILGCFNHGYFHATIVLALVCPLLALGQVMTRMELNFIGLPLGNRKGPTTWTILTRIVAFWAVMNLAVIGSLQFKLAQGLGVSNPDLVAIFLVNFAMYAFTVSATANTRKTLRTAFHINEKHCFDFEDLFFSTFLLPFAICQMARHTASFSEYHAVCFSSNGLPSDVQVFKRKPFEDTVPSVVNGKMV